MDDFSAITARLDKVERENRRLKRAGTAGLVIAACIVVMGQAKPLPDVIEARSFVVKDSDGRPRIELGFRDNSSGIMLKDSAGTTIVEMALLHDAIPIVAFSDSQGKTKSALYSDSYGVLSDTPGQFSIFIGPSPTDSADKEPRIILHGTDGFSASLGSDDLITTRTGEKHKRSAASLVLFSKDGKVIWSAP